MNFFEDLLTSYGLLKKRKLRIKIDESSRIDEANSDITYGKLLLIAKHNNPDGQVDPSTAAGKTIEEITRRITSVFSGSTPGQSGDSVSVNLAGDAELVKEFGITQPKSENTEGDTTKSDKSTERKPDSAALDSPTTSDESCAGAVYWTARGASNPNRDAIVNKECNTTFQFEQFFTNEVTRWLWQSESGAEVGEDLGTNADYQEFRNTRIGVELQTAFPPVRTDEDGNTVLDGTLGDLVALYTKFKQDPEKWGRYGDIYDNMSFFGAVSKTMSTGKTFGASLGELGGLKLERSIANPDQIEGAVDNLLNLLPALTNPITDDGNPLVDQLEMIRDNFKLVETVKGKTLLFISDGFGDLGIQFDGGRHKELIDTIKEYNGVVEKLDDDHAKTLVIETIDRGLLKTRDTSVKSTAIITNVSENIDRIILLLSLERWEQAKKEYNKLDNEYKKNIGKVLQISDAVYSGEMGTTEIAEEWIEAMSQIEDVSDTFGGFLRVAAQIRGETIKNSGAIAALRTGDAADAGKQGFKADQVLLFSGDKDGEEKAEEYFGSTPDKVALGDIAALIGGKVEDIIKDWGLDSSYDSETEVYAAWDSLKYYTSGNPKLSSTRTYQDTILETLSQLTVGKNGMFDDHVPGQKEGRNILLDEKWMSAMRENIRIPKADGTTRAMRQTEQMAMVDVFEGMRKGLASIDQLLNPDTRTPNLDGDQIRSELMAAVPSDTGLYMPSEDDLGKFSANRKKKREADLKDQFVHGFLRKGLAANDPRYKHVIAWMFARGAIDRDDCNDVICDVSPTKRSFKKYKRNKLVRDAVSPMIASDNPLSFLHFRESGTGFNLGGRGTEGVGHGLSYTSGNGIGRDGSIGLTGRDEPEMDLNSTHYSSKELMNKLLEVQQLMFSHLIKE